MGFIGYFIFFHLNSMDACAIISIQQKYPITFKTRETDVWPFETICFHVFLNQFVIKLHNNFLFIDIVIFLIFKHESRVIINCVIVIVTEHSHVRFLVFIVVGLFNFYVQIFYFNVVRFYNSWNAEI
jgi:hypothetical protein